MYKKNYNGTLYYEQRDGLGIHQRYWFINENDEIVNGEEKPKWGFPAIIKKNQVFVVALWATR